MAYRFSLIFRYHHQIWFTLLIFLALDSELSNTDSTLSWSSNEEFYTASFLFLCHFLLWAFLSCLLYRRIDQWTFIIFFFFAHLISC
ncbi:hypothetical protein V8F33_013041 [Rhypophila sp. PSN 637]